MPSPQKLPITITTPDGLSHECEVLMMEDAGEIYPESLNVPISMHQSKYFDQLSGDEVTLQSIEDSVLFALTDDVSVGQSWDDGLSFTVKPSDVKLSSDKVFYSVGDTNHFMQEIQDVAGKNAIISQDPFIVKAIASKFELLTNEYTVSSDDLKNYPQIMANDERSISAAIVKAGLIDYKEMYGYDFNSDPTDVMEQIHEYLGVPEHIVEALSDIHIPDENQYIEVLSKQLDGMDFGQQAYRDVVEKSLYLTRKDVSLDKIDNEMPLVPASSEFESKNVNVSLNGVNYDVVAYSHKPIDTLNPDAESVLMMMAIVEPSLNEATIIKGEGIDLLSDKISEPEIGVPAIKQEETDLSEHYRRRM